MPKYDLRFDLVETLSQQRQLEGFLLSHVGGYAAGPYQQWVEDVCMPGIEHDDRRALAWWQHNRMVGDAVLKPLSSNRLELKNFRIAPGSEGKYLGSVMMAHVSLEGQDLLEDKGLLDGAREDFAVQLDTSPVLVPYFRHHGFVPVAMAPLYVPERTEVIMERTVPLH
jgi:hypothetical protein